MTDFIVKKLPYDLRSHAGLAFVGKYLKQINFNSMIDPAFPVRSGNTNSDIVKSYLALLCLGKNDFEAIENFRGESLFMRALGLKSVASGSRLCVSALIPMLALGLTGRPDEAKAAEQSHQRQGH